MARERSDAELMLAAQAGSVESFERLISRHRSAVVRFLLRMNSDLDLVEDVCQEAFLRAWVFRDNYRASGSFGAYLLQIAKRVMLNALRKAGKTIPIEEISEPMDAGVGASPENSLLSKDGAAAITRCIDALPSHLAIIFRAVAVEGMKYAEAAEVLDVPLGTVKSRMNEAVRRLRAALLEEGLL